MNKIMLRIGLCVILLTAAVGGYIYIANSRPNPTKIVEYIYRRYDPDKGGFNDLTDELGFTGIDSLGYDQLDNQTVRIKWGNKRYAFDVTVDDLLNNKKLVQMINRMGMTIQVKHDKKTDTNTFIVKYRGEKVSEYDLEVGGKKWLK